MRYLDGLFLISHTSGVPRVTVNAIPPVRRLVDQKTGALVEVEPHPSRYRSRRSRSILQHGDV